MGSGLIWAGIGKGISDAGAAYGSAMGRAAELEWKQQEEEKSFQRKLDMEDKRAETLKQRVISEIQAINAKADEIAAGRADKQLTTDAGKIADVASKVKGDSPAMSQDEIKQLMKDNPQYAETYRKAGLIESKTLTPEKQLIQGSQDKIDAAISLGAHSSVIEAFQKNKDSVLKEIREDNKDRRDQARLDQGERRLDLMEERITSQNTTDRIRADKPTGGGKGKDTGDKPPTGIDLERSAKAAKQALALELGVPEKEVAEKVAQLRKNNKLTGEAQTRLDAYNSALTKWQNYKTNLPSSNSNSSDNSSSRPPLGSFRR